MNAATRLAAYAGALALVFGAAWDAGVLLGPPAVAEPVSAAAPAPARTTSGHHQMDGMDMDGMDMGGDAGDDSSPDVGTDGLATTAQGWTFALATTTFQPGVTGDMSFAVVDEVGRRVMAFPTPPHLAVVRRDGFGFQWVDPVAAPDGSWHAPLRLTAPGIYRVVAELDGPVLGADLFVPGAFAPVPATAARTAEVDGFQVRLDGDLQPNQPAQLVATVSRGGAPVADLEPDGSGFGRLVTLRAGDLAYGIGRAAVGSEPSPADRSGPAVAFTTIVPSVGSYWVFLRFREKGVPHTAAFFLTARGGQ